MIAPSDGSQFIWSDVELDEPRDDEILIRIHAVGVCHTDLVALAGAFGWERDAVLGHEGAGVVERTGAAVTKVSPGDRVVISFSSCGQCRSCERGRPSYCREFPALNLSGTRPDGSSILHRDGQPLSANFFGQSSFATHAITHERNVVHVPDDIPLELAAPLGCGIQTGFGAVTISLDCQAGSSILIAGGGPVGLSAVMGAVNRQCRSIILVEPHEARRQLALGLGATHAIDPATATELPAALRALEPEGVDYAIDTSGIPAVLESLPACLAPLGTVGIVGVTPQGTRAPGEANGLIAFGHTMRGISEGDSDPNRFLPELMALYREGKLPLDKLISTYPIADINHAIADQHDGKCVKIVLTLDN